MSLVDSKTVKEIIEVLTQNFLLPRWSLLGKIQTNYNQLTKHGLNCIIAFCIAVEAEKNDVKIIWERFPWIALKRAIQKTVNGDIRDDHIDQICKIGEIEREKFDQLMESKTVNKEVLERLSEASENWIETRIYKAATKLATYIEISEISPGSTEKQEVIDSMAKFMDLPGYSKMAYAHSNEYLFFEDVSKLRFCIRWVKRYKTCNCDVLGHMFETGILAWLMSLEKDSSNEQLATHLFWCGIFHDLPERWTGDMDSPIKDSVEGLRDATKKFELKMMKEHVYSKLPKQISDAIKHVMMEEKQNAKIRDLLKNADNISACCECYRNIMMGTRDHYFKQVIHKQYYNEKEKSTKSFQDFIEEIYKEVG